MGRGKRLSLSLCKSLSLRHTTCLVNDRQLLHVGGPVDLRVCEWRMRDMREDKSEKVLRVERACAHILHA